MPDITTKKRKKRTTSNRVLAMYDDPNSVWGKNKPLETFWSGMASGKYVVVIYKDNTHEYVSLPTKFTKKYNTLFNDFDNDATIKVVLFSTPSQDAYEIYLYPKATNKSVDYVISNYSKYFKSMGIPPKDVIESGAPLMKKVRVPT